MTTGSLPVTSSPAPPPSLGLLAEQYFPALGALAAVVGWYAAGCPFPSPPDNLFASSATVSSVFAGFLGASGAIVLTIKDTELFKILSTHGYTQDIFRYLRDSLFASTVFAVFSILGFFVTPLHEAGIIPPLGIFRPMFVGAASLSLLTFVRVSHVLFKLLRQGLGTTGTDAD